MRIVGGWSIRTLPGSSSTGIGQEFRSTPVPAARVVTPQVTSILLICSSAAHRFQKLIRLSVSSSVNALESVCLAFPRLLMSPERGDRHLAAGGAR